MAKINDSPKDLEKELVKSIPELNDLPEDKREKIVAQILTIQKVVNSPIPSAETLNGYKKIDRDMPKKIMAMADMFLRHRIEQEKAIIQLDKLDTENVQNDREFQKDAFRKLHSLNLMGLFMGFFLVVFFGVLGFILIREGHELAGTFFSGSSILGLATIFVLRKTYSKSNRDKK